MIANEWKCCFIVIKWGARPGCRCMTCPTIPVVLTIVNISVGMTGKTITLGIFVNAVDVTGFAFNVDM